MCKIFIILWNLAEIEYNHSILKLKENFLRKCKKAGAFFSSPCTLKKFTTDKNVYYA